LVLFNFVGKHGVPLNNMMDKEITDKPIYMIHGQTDVDEREMIRKVVDKEENSILLASYGTCSTGINIRNIHNIIFASPSKSVIRVLQSIGRGLRTSDSKDKAVVYDVADNLHHKKYVNHTYKHMEERIKIYTNEGFDYDVVNIRLGGSTDGQIL
jgi:superfamily II DNA or RNA helicase